MKTKQIQIVTFYALLASLQVILFFMVINNIAIINRVTTDSEDGQNILMDAIWFNTLKAFIIFLAAVYCSIEAFSKYKFYKMLNFKEKEIFAKYSKPVSERDTFNPEDTGSILPKKEVYFSSEEEAIMFDRAHRITDTIDHTTKNKIDK